VELVKPKAEDSARVEEFSKMLFNTFRYKLSNTNEIRMLAFVFKVWAKKLDKGEYPESLLALRLVTKAKAN
jgi:hypothetical protein